MAANSWRVTISAASRMAPGGVVPGSLRAAFCTNRWARHEASSARPSQSEDQSRCACREHRLRGDVTERVVEDERGVAAGREGEAQGAGAAEAEGVPAAERLEGDRVALADREHLVAGRAVRVAPGGREDRVGVLPVGDDRRLLAQGEGSRTVALDEARGVAGVAADADLGGRRGQQELLGRHPAGVVAQPFRAAVPDQAGHLDVVHRQDHRRGRAVAADRADHRGGGAQVVAEPAELGRDEGAEQPLGPEGVDGLLREPRLDVDIGRVDRRDLAADAVGEGGRLFHGTRGRRGRASIRPSPPWRRRRRARRARRGCWRSRRRCSS